MQQHIVFLSEKEYIGYSTGKYRAYPIEWRQKDEKETKKMAHVALLGNAVDSFSVCPE